MLYFVQYKLQRRFQSESFQDNNFQTPKGQASCTDGLSFKLHSTLNISFGSLDEGEYMDWKRGRTKLEAGGRIENPKERKQISRLEERLLTP